MGLFTRKHSKWEKKVGGLRERTNLETGWREIVCRKGHRKMYNPANIHSHNNALLWIMDHYH